jgi:hypothetical protein
MRREIDHALNAVLEPKMQIIAERFCGNDVLQHDLLQRRNGLELRLGPRQVPILDQLRAMHCRPLRHQAESARRKAPPQQSQCLDGDQRLLAGIAHVKVRRLVVAVVHLHNDTEEPADQACVKRLLAEGVQ